MRSEGGAQAGRGPSAYRLRERRGVIVHHRGEREPVTVRSSTRTRGSLWLSEMPARCACAVLTLQEKKQLVFDGVADGKFAEMTKLSAKDLQFLFRN